MKTIFTKKGRQKTRLETLKKKMLAENFFDRVLKPEHPVVVDMAGLTGLRTRKSDRPGLRHVPPGRKSLNRIESGVVVKCFLSFDEKE